MPPPKNFVPTPFEYHQEIELEITSLTNLGAGVGRVDGWVVFVPLTLPGERVRARVWRNKSNYSEADLVSVVVPSPERVQPVCPLFTRCGGCQYQHYSYAGQLEWKRRQVSELLERLGGIKAEVQPTWPSPKQYHYRSKITPHFQRPKSGRELEIGFLKDNSKQLIDVPQCPIATESINAVLPEVRESLRSKVHKLKRGGTLLLRDAEEGVITDMKALATARVGERVFQFQAGEFFQNNPYILPGMVDYVLEQATAPGLEYLVDAYCGVGVFALSGANRFKEVAGVEVNAIAVGLANTNLKLNGVTNCSFLLGNAEAIFEGIRFDPARTSIIIDPPRRGCDEAFLEQFVKFGPARSVYVSCGPDTQARDLKYLTSHGYRIDRVQPFDLFPQTRHIENVVTLSRADG